MSRPRVLVSLPLVVALAGCTNDAAGPTRPQIWYLDTHSPDVPEAMLHRVGVIRRAADDGGTTTHRSCGATFVTPTLAVTAAHCVPFGEVAFEAPVVTIDTFAHSLSREVVEAQATVTGSWPDFEQPAPEGYEGAIDQHLTGCRVVRRCDRDDADGASGECGVSLGASSIVSVELDLAAVECPTRTRSDHATLFTGVVARGTGVVVAWFHEVVDAPNDRTYGNQELYDHYTTIVPSSPRLSNYHYMKHLFKIPLFVGGGPRASRSVTSVGDTIEADVPSCHGMSGSGVFTHSPEGTESQLLGVAHGGSADGPGDDGRLCQDPAFYRPAETYFTAPARLAAFLDGLGE